VTWTYSPTSITTDLAKVRLQIGDTDTDDQLLSDEEINYVLGRYAGVDRASYECAKILLAQPEAARAFDRTGTGFSATRSQRFQHLKDIVDQWKAGASLKAQPSLTGMSKSEKTSLEADTDYVPAAFERGLHDNDG
jgi:hypothetical protein